MSKPLSAEWQQKIDDEALELTKRFKDNNDYQAGCIQGFQDGYSKGAVVYGTQLIEAQERIAALEDALRTIRNNILEQGPKEVTIDNRLHMIIYSALHTANKALTPNNKMKEDE